MSKKEHIDPNLVVESWKDGIYDEIKNLSGKNLDGYFKRKADEVLKNHGLILRTRISRKTTADHKKQ